MFLWIADGGSRSIKLVICNFRWCLTSPETPPRIKSKENDSREDKGNECLQYLCLKIVLLRVGHRGDDEIRLFLE